MKHGKLHHHKRLKVHHVHGKKTTATQMAAFVLVTLLALGTMDYLIVSSGTDVFQADQTLNHHAPDGV